MNNEGKEKALDRIQRAHDDLKRCHFRTTLSPDDLGEYIAQLFELSSAWSNYCYHVNWTEAEKRLIKGFCEWIHDYNGVVLRIRRDVGVARYWLPYFETMLNVTHVFLDTGDMGVFYKPYIDAKGTKKEDGTIGERWCLVTKEMCGIDSPELPRYFPVTLPLCTNSEKMKEYFIKDRWYGFGDVSIEQRTQYYEDWERNLKPVLTWINKNLVSKTAKDSGATYNQRYSG